MKISFHGAARMVTGSKHLLTLENGKKILLDCGLFQGGKETYELNRSFGFKASEISALILSHAHIDHSGLIPKLIKDGFRGRIFCSDATKDLSALLIQDSAKIQEADTEHINKKRKNQHLPPYESLYSVDDAEKSLQHFQSCPTHQYFNVIEGVECMFLEAGHILGSNIIHLKIKENNQTKTLCFSGDIGRYGDPILKNPDIFPSSDYIICESTYGDTLHDDLAVSDQILMDEIYRTCVVKKGKLLIPAFSIGRTQEIVYALNRLDISNQLPNISFYVDSPMSSEATDITIKHKECYNDSLLQYMKTDANPFEFKNLHFITSHEDSMALNTDPEPCVIISASGMADSGRIKHHIAHNVSDAKNTILIVGYCEPRSLGAILQTDIRSVRIFGTYYPKNADVRKIKSLSAHGDYSDLLRFLSCQNPKEVQKVFLVHGEYEVQLHFKEKLLQAGFENIAIPELHESFEL